jgi:hypothetical protein
MQLLCWLPALLIGVGIGAGAAVGVKNLDPAGDALRAYLNVSSALLGAALGLLAARSTDAMQDRRKLRRKMHLNLIAIEQWRVVWTKVAELMRDIDAAASGSDGPIKAKATIYVRQKLFKECGHFRFAIQFEPDLSEALDTREDFEGGGLLLSHYRLLKAMMDRYPDPFIGSSKQSVDSWIDTFLATIKNEEDAFHQIVMLDAVEKHLRKLST